MSANKGYLFWFMVFSNIGSFLLSYSGSDINQLSEWANVRFGWKTEDEKHLHLSLLTSIGTLGMAIGSLVSGMIMIIGRRRTLMLCIILSMVAVTITLYVNLRSC